MCEVELFFLQDKSMDKAVLKHTHNPEITQLLIKVEALVRLTSTWLQMPRQINPNILPQHSFAEVKAGSFIQVNIRLSISGWP